MMTAAFSAGAAVPERLDRLRVLVIEDDPAVRFNLLSYLEDCGFEVFEADTGPAGLALARHTDLDLVLCDLRMPGMDGLQVIAALREELPALPLIVVSGTGVLGDVVEALRRGAWDFVVKPILDLAMLEHAIAAVLEKAQLVRENKRYQRELELANRSLSEHLEQYQTDAAAGRALQMQMMPPAERQIGGYKFGRLLLPSLSLSGDFVDYFMLDAERLGFYIADVSGHGVSSAFVTVLLKGLFERYRQLWDEAGDRTVLDPAAALTRLNRDLLQQPLDRKYLTCFYGVIDTVSNTLTYSNAGHFPQPILVEGEAARYLEEKGPPVGLFAQSRYENVNLALPDAHALLMVSDGVLEAMCDASLKLKCERLRHTVATVGVDAAALLQALGVDRTVSYPDDITALTVKREV
ncbi:MAG: SpoIIE family protein phosphatase [Thiotrichales bacterium]